MIWILPIKATFTKPDYVNNSMESDILGLHSALTIYLPFELGQAIRLCSPSVFASIKGGYNSLTGLFWVSEHLEECLVQKKH